MVALEMCTKCIPQNPSAASCNCFAFSRCAGSEYDLTYYTRFSVVTVSTVSTGFPQRHVFLFVFVSELSVWPNFYLDLAVLCLQTFSFLSFGFRRKRAVCKPPLHWPQQLTLASKMEKWKSGEKSNTKYKIKNTVSLLFGMINTEIQITITKIILLTKYQYQS